MAEPARKYPESAANDPRVMDPINPTPLRDPTDGQFQAANEDPRVDHRTIVENQSRGAGGGVMIAVVALVLAAIAYFMFSTDRGPETPAATPTVTAPGATAPAAPVQPAPTATQPAPAAPAN